MLSKYFNLEVICELTSAVFLAVLIGYVCFAATMWTSHRCPASTSLRAPLESYSEHPVMEESRKLAESTHRLQLQVAELRRLVEEKSGQ